MIKTSNKAVTVTFSNEVLTEIETYCEKLGISKTAFVNIACRQYLQAETLIDKLRQANDVKLKDA